MKRPLIKLLPAAQAARDKLGDGCLVHFYDDRNYLGSNLTLVGPVGSTRSIRPM